MQQRVMHKGKKAMLVPHLPILGKAIFERALSSSYTCVFARHFLIHFLVSRMNVS